MAWSTGRLSTAPDDYSDGVGGHKTIGTAPQFSGCVNNRYGAGPTLNSDEGADMAQSTRGPNPVDRQTRDSGVKITPLARMVPVATTPSIA